MFVKICGLTDQATIDAAVEAGVDALGFVFADSVREIAPAQARELCRSLPADTIRVAVMHHPSRDHFLNVVENFEPDWIQTDAEDFAALPAAPSTQRLAVFREGATHRMTDFPARLLFEGRVSGKGTTADWDEAARIAKAAELILAGGLDPENISAAIAHVRPFGVDVSSGVESQRGKKDAKKIKEFVARVRVQEFNQ